MVSLNASGDSTQMAWQVDGIDAVVTDLKSRGVAFEEVGAPGMKTVNSIAHINGNYPSKGRGERAPGSLTAKATSSAWAK